MADFTKNGISETNWDHKGNMSQITNNVKNKQSQKPSQIERNGSNLIYTIVT